jgi:hypothetical protein
MYRLSPPFGQNLLQTAQAVPCLLLCGGDEGALVFVEGDVDEPRFLIVLAAQRQVMQVEEGLHKIQQQDIAGLLVAA